MKRAAELQVQEGGGERALSLEELEEVAGELGISSALVRRAASDVAVRPDRDDSTFWLGGATAVLFETAVAGSVDDETMTAMVEVLRRYMGDPGTLEQQGSTRVWSPRDSSRRVFLTVVERADSTTLRLEERMPMDAQSTVGGTAFAGSFGGFLGILPLKVLVGKAAALAALGPLVVVGGTAGWLVGRAWWKRRSGGRERALREMFAQLVEIASASASAD